MGGLENLPESSLCFWEQCPNLHCRTCFTEDPRSLHLLSWLLEGILLCHLYQWTFSTHLLCVSPGCQDFRGNVASSATWAWSGWESESKREKENGKMEAPPRAHVLALLTSQWKFSTGDFDCWFWGHKPVLYMQEGWKFELWLLC